MSRLLQTLTGRKYGSAGPKQPQSINNTGGESRERYWQDLNQTTEAKIISCFISKWNCPLSTHTLLQATHSDCQFHSALVQCTFMFYEFGNYYYYYYYCEDQNFWRWKKKNKHIWPKQTSKSNNITVKTICKWKSPFNTGVNSTVLRKTVPQKNPES